MPLLRSLIIIGAPFLYAWRSYGAFRTFWGGVFTDKPILASLWSQLASQFWRFSLSTNLPRFVEEGSGGRELFEDRYGAGCDRDRDTGKETEVEHAGHAEDENEPGGQADLERGQIGGFGGPIDRTYHAEVVIK